MTSVRARILVPVLLLLLLGNLAISCSPCATAITKSKKSMTRNWPRAPACCKAY